MINVIKQIDNTRDIVFVQHHDVKVESLFNASLAYGCYYNPSPESTDPSNLESPLINNIQLPPIYKALFHK